MKSKILMILFSIALVGCQAQVSKSKKGSKNAIQEASYIIKFQIN